MEHQGERVERPPFRGGPPVDRRGRGKERQREQRRAAVRPDGRHHFGPLPDVVALVVLVERHPVERDVLRADRVRQRRADGGDGLQRGQRAAGARHLLGRTHRRPAVGAQCGDARRVGDQGAQRQDVDGRVVGAAGVGGVAGAVGQIGAGAHNRAKIKAMEFATGRGGAISQLVGKVGGALFGANMDKLKAQHSMAEGTQHLWGRIQGLLKLHPEGLTGKMYKDFIAQQPVKPGGPKVNITKLPSTSKLKDDEVYTADRIKDVLIPNTISELYESGQTGQTAEITTEAIERLIIGGLASGKDIGEMIAHLDTGGFIPPP